MTIEIEASGPWDETCTTGQVFKQAKDEACLRISNMAIRDSKSILLVPLNHVCIHLFGSTATGKTALTPTLLRTLNLKI